MTILENPMSQLSERRAKKFARGKRGFAVGNTSTYHAVLGREVDEKSPADAGWVLRDKDTIKWYGVEIL